MFVLIPNHPTWCVHMASLNTTGQACLYFEIVNRKLIPTVNCRLCRCTCVYTQEEEEREETEGSACKKKGKWDKIKGTDNTQAIMNLTQHWISKTRENMTVIHQRDSSHLPPVLKGTQPSRTKGTISSVGLMIYIFRFLKHRTAKTLSKAREVIHHLAVYKWDFIIAEIIQCNMQFKFLKH